MERIRRQARIAAMTRQMVAEPNKSFALSGFCEAFGAAKSTVSEDIEIVRAALEAFSLGGVETLPGAAGGVRYRVCLSGAERYAQVEALCEKLRVPGRVLPGELLYLADIIADPLVMGPMAEVLASEFAREEPDFVLTMETQGIPMAVLTAHQLHIPVVIARRASKVYEGSTVHINYLAGAQFKTMSLSRRLVRPGQRVLLVDDVLRSGGTATGMFELMREFDAEVVGGAVLVGLEPACAKFAQIKPLMILESVDSAAGTARLRPGDWLKA